jgi:hypothetical protein
MKPFAVLRPRMILVVVVVVAAVAVAVVAVVAEDAVGIDCCLVRISSCPVAVVAGIGSVMVVVVVVESNRFYLS